MTTTIALKIFDFFNPQHNATRTKGKDKTANDETKIDYSSLNILENLAY